MWKPLIRCSIVGGIVVFLWSMISWTVLPIHKMTMNAFSSPTAAKTCIMENTTKDGVYIYPGMGGMSEAEDKGPMIFVNVAKNVQMKNMSKQLVIGLITQIIGAFLITYLLLRAKAMNYWARVRFVTVAGFAVAVLGTIPAWNWWHFSGVWTFVEMLDLVISWFLGGLIIAKLTTRK